MINMNLDDFFEDYGKEKTDLPCDIYEKNNKYYIEIDLPGYSKEEIKVEVIDDILAVSVFKNFHEDKKRVYLKKERVYKKMDRTFSLGKVKDSEIDAKLNDGVLTIIIPKKETISSRRIIEIK